MKKIIFALSFLVLSGLFFGLTTSEVKAITLSELQTHITRLQAQVIELQRLLSEISGIQVPETGIEPKATDRTEDFAPGRLIVRFKDNVPESTQAEILKAHGLTIKGEIKQLKVKIVSVPEKAEERLAQALSSNPNIKWAEPDYVAEIQLIPNDPYFDIQWGLEMVQAPEAWDITTGSSDVVIAILDTGIDTSHPDLKDKIVDNVNFTDSPSADDLYGHGTFVAGIAAAATNNAIGVAGLGYDSSMMNVKVLNDSGSGSYSWVATGIIWAADNGAHVINMSLGSTWYSRALEDAVNYAWSKGVVVMAGAGNNGTSSPFYPAFYDNCIAVAATSKIDAKPGWSNYGDWVDVAAPGVYIYSTWPDSSYYYGRGTSAASPHVAGLAGLLASIVTDKNGNGFINDEIRLIIENTTDPLDWEDTPIINGRINAFSAVSSVGDITYTLSVNSSPVTGISITSATGHSGTTNYIKTVEEGTTVFLTTPATYSNYQFTSWTGCDSVKDTTCNLVMQSNRTVTVNYKGITHTLSVSKAGTGSGTVTSNPAGIDCGNTCSATYNQDTSVTLTATPDTDSVFSGWSGVCTGKETCTVTMNTDKSVTATFDAIDIIDCAKEYGQEYWCSNYEGWEKECQGRGDVKDLPQETFCKDELGDLHDKCVTCWVPTHNLSVNSSPITGISITSTTGHSGTTNYAKTVEEGTPVSLTAPSSHVIPGSNITYDFVSWSGTGCSSDNTTVNLEITNNITCTANYKESITAHTLTISSTANGSVINPGQGNFSYNQGETVNLLAVADLGYRFINWTGDTNTISNTEHSQTTITIEGDYSITANFKQAPECTTYNGNTYCRGFRSTDSQGSSCNAACSERGYTCPVGDNMFRSLSEVSQVAVELGLLGSGESYGSGASAGYYSPYIRKALTTGAKIIFYDSGWNQSCTHTPPTGSGFERVKICLCQESIPIHTLSVTKSGTGSGTVTSNPAGISCGTTCSASYNQGTSITLTATPDTDSTFTGWSGDCTGNTCTIEMNSNKSVTATFDAINIIDCAKKYGQEYWCSNYEGWEKECQGRGDVKDLPQETFCKDGLGDIYDKCVTCWVPTHTLSVNSSPVTGITIGSTTGHSGTTNYAKTIEEGTSVSLTAPSSYATPTANYDFTGWSGTGCSSNNNTVRFSVISNMTCTANYKESITTYTLSVTKSGTGSGTVNSNPAGINCGTTCSASYNQGTSITLTATPNLDSTFIGWSGACVGKETCTITMTSNKSVTATFDKKSTIPEGCTIYNGYIYCRGFSSTDPQGSSCNAACSERGYTCPTGDNMFRSVSQVAQVATTLELLSSGEIYRYGTHRNYYSPYIRTTLSTEAKTIYYDANWNQICTHAPSTAPNQERVKICRCQEVIPSQSLKDAENQLASLSNVLSQLIESLTSLIRR